MPMIADDKKNCFTCDHAAKLPGVLAQRACKQGPPPPVLMPVGQGQATVQYVYPLVSRGDVCDCWAPMPGQADA